MKAATLVLLICASCAADSSPSPECRLTEECDQALCIGGTCESLTRPDLPNQSSPLDGGSSQSAPAIDQRGPCAASVPATTDLLVLNELLANVPAGDEGDANGDGTRDAYEDEFVELVNIGDEPLELVGVRISVAGKLKHTFEPLCLLPHTSIVVFGGGAVGGGVVGNALIADTRLSLANDGGVVQLATPDGGQTTVEYRTAPAASLTRVPQLSGPDWVNHLDLSSRPFSPGTCPNGSELASGCAPVNEPADAGDG